MSEQAWERSRRDAIAAQRYARYQREIRRGQARAATGPRPREFDTNGFPIPQRSPGFLERIARLLNPL